MSLENSKSGKPSRYLDGEGCHAASSNRQLGAVDSGGVSEDDTTGRTTKISWESSRRGTATSQLPDPGGHAAKAGQARGAVGVLRSSDELAYSKGAGERREGTWVNVNANSEGSGDGRSAGETLFERITTPPKIQKLQRTLYRKAKAEPKYRFYSLYGELLRKDLLETAMASVAHNNGAAGIDGQECAVYSSSDEAWDTWRDALLEELRTKKYRPSPVRRVYIPKGDGKERPLGIPTVKDRVVQTAVSLLLLPILEADSHPHSYAYRPQRNAHQAMDAIKAGLLTGRVEVIDADLSGYFDSIPHRKLLRIVARRVSDGAILKLIRGWLRAPIVEPANRGSGPGNRPNCQGTPQGGVISPMLANAYLNQLDWEVNERCELEPVMVRYADDFVILSRPGQGAALQERLKRWLTGRGLVLNEKKTRLVDIQQEGIRFLGFALTWRKGRSGRNHYPHVEPHPKSLKKLRDGIREKLNRGTLWRPVDAVISDLNRQLKGWAGYFHYGNSTRVMGEVEYYVRNKLQRWLWRKHGCRSALWSTYTPEDLHERMGLHRLPRHAAWKLNR